jgi:hypothetical protein
MHSYDYIPAVWRYIFRAIFHSFSKSLLSLFKVNFTHQCTQKLPRHWYFFLQLIIHSFF